VNKQQTSHSKEWKEKNAEENKVIEKFTGGKTGHLGIYLLNPEGERLTEKNLFRASSAAEVETALKESLKKFGPVTQRQATPAWQDSSLGVGGCGRTGRCGWRCGRATRT
jgi:hypothetical protein